jgi:hypothetical protein
MNDLDPRKYPKGIWPESSDAGRRWFEGLSRDEALVYRALYAAVARGGFSLFGFGDAPAVCGTVHPIEFVRDIIHAVDDARSGRQ